MSLSASSASAQATICRCVLRQQFGGHFTHERIVLNVENFQGVDMVASLGRRRASPHQCVFCTSHSPGLPRGLKPRCTNADLVSNRRATGRPSRCTLLHEILNRGTRAHAVRPQTAEVQPAPAQDFGDGPSRGKR